MDSDFIRYMPALRSWLARRLRNAADTEDALQDIWLRSQAHLAGTQVDKPRAYLFQTAHSVLTDRARRAATRHEKAHGPLEEMHHPVEGITPERVLMGKEALAGVAACLAAMPERTRDIFVLHRFEGMSYAQIAKNFGISVSAVEKHIMKALQILLDETR